MTLEERNKLVEDNQKLVWFVIRRFYPTFWHDEDLVQTGMIGLIRAADTYDPEKGSFSHFAIVCIRNEMMMEFKRRLKQPDALALETPMFGDDDLSIADKYPSDEVVDISVLDICNDVLSEKEAELFRYVADGGSISDLARERNVSKQSISQVYRKACAKLKMALKED